RLQEPNEIADYIWPAGTLFALSIHKHKDYWEESKKFNQDRWMVKCFERINNFSSCLVKG
ncbi:2454_t:CDS:1, partial [Funneliformis geosporum]